MARIEPGEEVEEEENRRNEEENLIPARVGLFLIRAATDGDAAMPLCHLVNGVRGEPGRGEFYFSRHGQDINGAR